jgi:SAM-dependent methyltransferase
VYDDPAFFAGYREMRAKRSGLHETVVEPALARLLGSDLAGARVLDLGCGDGWFTQIALDAGASLVVGVDPSKLMLERARISIPDPRAQFVHAFAEDAAFEPAGFDIVASILALHYVANDDFARVTRSISGWLVPEGVFVLMVEHPVMTCQQELEWVKDHEGEPIAWPVRNYHQEGPRVEAWFIDGVIKYHRRIETVVNALNEARFGVEQLLEPAPSAEAVARADRKLSSAIRPEVLAIRARVCA